MINNNDNKIRKLTKNSMKLTIFSRTAQTTKHTIGIHDHISIRYQVFAGQIKAMTFRLNFGRKAHQTTWTQRCLFDHIEQRFG